MLTLPVSYHGRLLRQSVRRRSEIGRLYRIAKEVAVDVEAALEGCGLGAATMSAAGTPGVWNSRVTHVDIAEPVRVTIALRPGLVFADLEKVADRLAESLGVPLVELEHRRPGLVVLTAPTPDDPWRHPVPSAAPVDSVVDPVFLGRAEDGSEVNWSLVEDMHAIVQGQTRSGKTTGIYGMLSQLSRARDVHVTGCDPTGLLLKPWSRLERHRGWQSLGMADPVAHVDVLERLVQRMDARIAGLPEGADRVEIGPDQPLTLVVMEEYPSLVKALKTAHKAAYGRLSAALFRLLTEGAKAGIRVLLVSQRADAEIVGGFERAQCSTRLSYRVDSVDALRMLHPGVGPELAAEHATVRPGICLLTRPGEPLTRLRAPNTPYADYVKMVDPDGGVAPVQPLPQPLAS